MEAPGSVARHIRDIMTKFILLAATPPRLRPRLCGRPGSRRGRVQEVQGCHWSSRPRDRIQKVAARGEPLWRDRSWRRLGPRFAMASRLPPGANGAVWDEASLALCRQSRRLSEGALGDDAAKSKMRSARVGRRRCAAYLARSRSKHRASDWARSRRAAPLLFAGTTVRSPRPPQRRDLWHAI